jgi:hypothetical protein
MALPLTWNLPLAIDDVMLYGAAMMFFALTVTL